MIQLWSKVDRLLPKLAPDLININYLVHVLQALKQPQEVITWRRSLCCNENNGKTLEESCRHGMELAQKGCVCSPRDRPAVAGHSSTLEPRWFCHKLQPLDLNFHRLFQPFFAVPSFLPLGMELSTLCHCTSTYTNVIWFYRVSVQTAFSLGRPFELLNCGMTVKRLWGLWRDGYTSLIMSL